MLIAVIAIMAVSCGGSKSEGSSPVDELISYYEDFASEISSVADINEMQTMAMEFGEKIKAEFGNSDYVLTDADREKIADTAIQMTKEIIGDQLSGIDIDEYLETAKTQVVNEFKKFNTLGELVSANNVM